MIAPSPMKRALFFIVIDTFISLSTLYLAYQLRFNFDVEPRYLVNFTAIFVTLTALKITVMALMRIYHVAWRFMSLYEAKKIVYAHIVAYALFVCVYYATPQTFIPLPRSVLVIDIFLSVIFIGVFRMAKRLWVEGQNGRSPQKTLLIGATAFGQTLLKEKNDFYISAIVDDSPMLVESYFANKQIQKMEQIEQIIEQEGIVCAIIAKVYPPKEAQILFGRLNAAGIYDIRALAVEKADKTLKKVTVEDLLARHPKDLDLETIGNFIQGKSVLITGAGGSIGSEIVRQCQKFDAKGLILVDNSEYNLYNISESGVDADLRLLDVTDREKLFVLFETVKPDIVIHAAAYKHVHLCESNPDAAVKNNVLGTKNVIDASIVNHVQKVVIISTDKAVRPTNVMGATKRVTELYAGNVDSGDTEIVAVRFGNVLGSSGSVIPKFKKQIEEGSSVTVTHPEVIRYFMLVSEACQLVLQAAAIAKGGELFVLDMGEPIKIVDLARQMIRLYGKEGEVDIVYSGLRPGEKLYEELLLDESERKTRYDSIFIAKPTPYPIKQLNHDIETLLISENKIKVLQSIIQEYKKNVLE